jgi:putative adhesin
MAEHRFNPVGPVELEISIPSGDIEVETGDGDECVVWVEGNEKLVEQTLVELQGNRLLVELRGKKAFGITIEIGGFSLGSEKLRVRARVPHGSAATLVTASADSQVDGRLGELELRTASGDLLVRGEIERNATLKSVSGDIRIDRVGGDVRGTSVSGDIRIDDVRGKLVLKSVSGDMRIGAVHGHEATLQSVSGDIQLGVTSGRNVDVDANTVSGDLSSDVALAGDAGDFHNGEPTLVVRGKTVSGDFRLVRS